MSKFNFKLISEFKYSKHEKYAFVLTDDLVFKIDLNMGDAIFYDIKGVPRLKFRENEITIFKNYAWDGASPKFFKLFGIWIGTPDFKKTILATCVHDALYQFMHTVCIDLDRNMIDKLFEEMMEQEGFNLTKIYSGAVKIFGGTFYKIGSILKKRTGYCE